MILGKLCQETMRLEYLTRIIQPLTLRGPLNFDIEGIAYDSRQVRKNFLFVALRGAHADGAVFVDDALRRGAVAIVSENDRWPRRDIAHIRVEDARRALAEISCAFYNHPSQRIEVFGITGTNGKTTTAFMLHHMLEAAGRQPGMIGTIRYEIGRRIIPASRTTPEAPDIHYMLEQMVQNGCRSVVMEVSSHALDQKRVWGLDFDVGIFTNLTRDHLDYHKDIRSYFLAKSQLFRGLGGIEKEAAAVINMDDQYGMEIANTPGLTARLITYGLHPGAMIRAENVQITSAGSSFLFVSPWGRVEVRLPLLGRYNVSNALAAMAAGCARDLKPEQMASSLSNMVSVPGRLELVTGGHGPKVFVDYAHTDDALANVLQTLRALQPRKLICVFGCGGDRDREKRSLMGAVAARLSDYVVITSDNPRTEKPDAIMDEIMAGIGGRDYVERIADREQAIAHAVARAQPGDIVLIAGKGHENYQDFGSTVVPFDDRDIARKYLRA